MTSIRSLLLAVVASIGLTGTAFAQASQRPVYVDIASYENMSPSNDRTMALQAAAQQAASLGLPLMINKTINVLGTVTLTRFPSLSFKIMGSGTITTNGQDLFHITPVANNGVGQFTQEVKMDVSGVTITNLGTKEHGTVFTFDCRNFGYFCISGGSEIHKINVNDTGSVVVGYGLSGMEVDQNIFTRNNITASTSVPWIDIEGSTSSAGTFTCNSGDFIDNNVATGGTFVLLNGCSQGLRIRDNNHLLGYGGVIETNMYLGESQQIIHNYLEEWTQGISITTNDGFDQIEQNSFDRSPVGSTSNYSAIVVGTATVALAQMMVDHNTLYGWGGYPAATPLFVNAGNGSVVDDNIIGGVLVPSSGNCMTIGFNNSGSASPGSLIAALTVSGNTCWVSGVINPLGTAFMARGNFFTNNSGVLTKFEQN